MCILAFSFDQTQEHFEMIANRDEFYSRTFDPYALHEGIFCGIDHKEGGTWMGLSLKGRFAILTNFRNMQAIKPVAKSRGNLVLHALTSKEPLDKVAQDILDTADLYNGFNLILYEGGQCLYVSSQVPTVQGLESGTYVLSNGLLNGEWYKESRLIKAFESLKNHGATKADYLNLLSDQVRAPDVTLPYTGLPYTLEKLISSIAIEGETYGTVCKQYVNIKGQSLDFTALNRNPHTLEWHKLDWNYNFGYNNT